MPLRLLCIRRHRRHCLFLFTDSTCFVKLKQTPSRRSTHFPFLQSSCAGPSPRCRSDVAGGVKLVDAGAVGPKVRGAVDVRVSRQVVGGVGRCLDPRHRDRAGLNGEDLPGVAAPVVRGVRVAIRRVWLGQPVTFRGHVLQQQAVLVRVRHGDHAAEEEGHRPALKRRAHLHPPQDHHHHVVRLRDRQLHRRGDRGVEGVGAVDDVGRAAHHLPVRIGQSGEAAEGGQALELVDGGGLMVRPSAICSPESARGRRSRAAR